MIYLLGASLVIFVLSGILELELLFVLSLVTAIVSLAGLRCPARGALLAFWCCVGGVLTFLLYAWPGETLLLGLPVPAFVMLLGIWIAPLFIWPLAFTRGFKRWVNKR